MLIHCQLGSCKEGACMWGRYEYYTLFELIHKSVAAAVMIFTTGTIHITFDSINVVPRPLPLPLQSVLGCSWTCMCMYSQKQQIAIKTGHGNRAYK